MNDKPTQEQINHYVSALRLGVITFAEYLELFLYGELKVCKKEFEERNPNGKTK